MNTPRLWVVENLSPYQFSQLKAFNRSTIFHGSPEPIRVAGKLMVWKATLSLPMNWTYSTSSAPSSSRHQRFQSAPVASDHSTVAPMYSMGASNQT